MSAADLKEQGNGQFKAGRFIQAIESYTQALSLSDDKHEKAVFYKNRAACHLKQVITIIKTTNISPFAIHFKEIGHAF